MSDGVVTERGAGEDGDDDEPETRVEPLLPPQTWIAWSKDEQVFRVVPAAVARVTSARLNSRGRRRRSVSLSEREDVQLDVDDFASLPVDGSRNALEAFVAARDSLWRRIMGSNDPEDELLTSSGSSSPLASLLPRFVTVWRRRLDALARLGDSSATAVVCEELQWLAEAATLLGDIVVARATLGERIRLARLHAWETRDEIVAEAKASLLRCVRYQEARKRCTVGVERKYAPRIVLRDVLAELESLLAVAPYAVDVAVLKVGVLLSMGRSKEALHCLAAFQLKDESAQLTLAHAHALECEGFYQESIAVAADFTAAPSDGTQKEENSKEAQEATALQALKTHAHQLQSLLASKATADDTLLQSNYEAAERGYAAALRAVRPASRRLRAALLLGRANAWIGLERLLSARNALEESVALDPANQLARVRLRTVELAQATEQIYGRMRRV